MESRLPSFVITMWPEFFCLCRTASLTSRDSIAPMLAIYSRYEALSLGIEANGLAEDGWIECGGALAGSRIGVCECVIDCFFSSIRSIKKVRSCGGRRSNIDRKSSLPG